MAKRRDGDITQSPVPPRGVPATVAVFGTVAIYAAAAVLSFGSLSDIAQRSNVTVPELWPLLIDGVVLAATVAVVAGAGGYAWFLVIAGTATSVASNVLHSALPDGPLPVIVRATVAAVPPLALVAVAHLTVTLRRTHIEATAAATGEDGVSRTHPIGDSTAPHHGDEQKGPHSVRTPDVLEEDISDTSGDIATTNTVAPPVATTTDQSPSDTATVVDDDIKARAMVLLADGVPPREVAEQLGIHRGTAYKWRSAALQAN
ncbi:hypothetical protein M2284_002635 [Rhodococcus sp. LBL1]|nr:hypothetical protein [Rhodococcus sp. LBL1]MDH6684019.1 hypothetical protein [Rhodococcus sp. LBL2]